MDNDDPTGVTVSNHDILSEHADISNERRIVVAIDGPSGVGKSTLSKALARRLGYLHIDSGAVYRAVALKSINAGVYLNDESGVASIVRDSDIRLEGDSDNSKILVDGCDVTTEIRSADVSRASSVVATLASVREAVVDKLREMSCKGGVVMEGRDIGTKVFPNAPVKLFLDANPAVRARRRWLEERHRGRDVTLEEIAAELEDRDRRDREREATPLVKAPDAILLDTSDLDLDSVIERALKIVKART